MGVGPGDLNLLTIGCRILVAQGLSRPITADKTYYTESGSAQTECTEAGHTPAEYSQGSHAGLGLGIPGGRLLAGSTAREPSARRERE